MMKPGKEMVRLGTLGPLVLITACGGPAPGPAPAAAPIPATTGAAFPSSPPAPLPQRDLEFPAFEEMTLPNGLQVIVVPHGVQPLATATLYLYGGAAGDPVERAGLAGMTADLLTQGTRSRSATEIAETIERVGGSVSASAGADWLTLSTNVLAEHLPLGMELLSESALHPTFPQEEVDLTRRRTLSGLQSALGQPGQIAQRIFDREVYGAAHPYGIHPLPGSVEAVTRDEIVDYHDRFFDAANALLVVTGDVEAEQVRALARQYFGAWERGERASIQYPTPQPQSRMEIRLVHRPNSAQTNIVVGHLGYRPTTPDYYPLVVMNGVIGGTPSARLFRILREERGWTYGSYSRFTRPVDIGYFTASAEVRPEVTDSALTVILAELERLQEERVGEEELAGTKGFLAGSFPLRIETAAQVGSQIATTRLLGLPVEHMVEFRERIQAVDAEDVQRVARDYVRPDAAVVVVVGDADQLLPRLEAIAPVRLYDVEGNPISREDLSG